jgi:hypothetical protein
MLDYLKYLIQSLNNSKLFAGLIMLLMNIGSKYITIKFSKSQEAYIRNKLGRQLLIFAITFIATKDIIVSFILTASFLILTDHLFNEDSPYCLIPKSMKKLSNLIDTDGDGFISTEEINNAIKVLTKAKKQKVEMAQNNAYAKFKNSMLI